MQLICERTGTVFEYRGVGRRPKYAPGARRDVQRERNARYYAKRKAEKNKPRADEGHGADTRQTT